MTAPRYGLIGDGHQVVSPLTRPHEGRVPYFVYSICRTPSYIYTKEGVSISRNNQQPPAMTRN